MRRSQIDALRLQREAAALGIDCSQHPYCISVSAIGIPNFEPKVARLKSCKDERRLANVDPESESTKPYRRQDGLVFVVGIIVIALLGRPAMRQLLLISLVGGAIGGVFLILWHKYF
jgi:hypothetical protein